MPRSRSVRRDSTHSSAPTEVTEGENVGDDDTVNKSKRSLASVYDAVAGRIGLNGFLTPEQMTSHGSLSILPEEVLLRRVNAPDELPPNFYHADEAILKARLLPDSDLLKATHAYTSDFYAVTSKERGVKDFRSFDGTALLALGILLEEASKVSLGENGDMALTEPDGMGDVLPESKMTEHQIIGRVQPRVLEHPASSPEDGDDLADEERPRKRRRTRTSTSTGLTND